MDMNLSVGDIVYYIENYITYKAIIFEEITDYYGNDTKYKILITHNLDNIFTNKLELSVKIVSYINLRKISRNLSKL